MEAMILLISLLIAVAVGYAADKFIAIADPGVARRLGKAEQLAVKREALEWVGLFFARVIPRYFRSIEQDLYWAAFSYASWASKTAAWVVGRQVLAAVAMGVITAWALRSNLGLLIGGVVGWTLMQADLAGKAGNARKRISQELPEFLQLMAAESASGAGLETVLSRAAQGEGYLPAWLRRTLTIAHGRSLLSTHETNAGILLQEAERSGHPDLVSFAIQMGFARQGSQVQEVLTRLATQFSDTYIGQAEVRTERMANTLGVLVAVFYFLPFLIVILFVVGVPLIEAF